MGELYDGTHLVRDHYSRISCFVKVLRIFQEKRRHKILEFLKMIDRPGKVRRGNGTPP